jgi:hypothetical protein
MTQIYIPLLRATSSIPVIYGKSVLKRKQDANLKRNDDKTAPCFKPFRIRKASDRFLPTPTSL